MFSVSARQVFCISQVTGYLSIRYPRFLQRQSFQVAAGIIDAGMHFSSDPTVLH